MAEPSLSHSCTVEFIGEPKAQLVPLPYAGKGDELRRGALPPYRPHFRARDVGGRHSHGQEKRVIFRSGDLDEF